MGRSWPSFIHEECSLYKFSRNPTTGLVSNIDYREEDLFWFNSTFDLRSEDSIKLQLQKYKTRVTECWSVSDFDLEQTQADGRTVRKFHFLEYSGTRQLAQDIWTMQSLLNAPKIHLYGISYGTSVFSTFATIFPSYVGLFVLDSNTVRSVIPWSVFKQLTSWILNN